MSENLDKPTVKAGELYRLPAGGVAAGAVWVREVNFSGASVVPLRKNPRVIRGTDRAGEGFEKTISSKRETVNVSNRLDDSMRIEEKDLDGGERITLSQLTGKPAISPGTQRAKGTMAKTKKTAAAKKGPRGERYVTFGKDPEFKEGTQQAEVYATIKKGGPMTVADVVADVAKRVKSKGNLANNVAFYVSRLRKAGTIKTA